MSLRTEAEAKDCWCPHARREGGDNIVTESLSMMDGGRVHAQSSVREVSRVSCIGSRCMAWIWTAYGDEGSERLGFCGLNIADPVEHFISIHRTPVEN